MAAGVTTKKQKCGSGSLESSSSQATRWHLAANGRIMGHDSDGNIRVNGQHHVIDDAHLYVYNKVTNTVTVRVRHTNLKDFFVHVYIPLSSLRCFLQGEKHTLLNNELYFQASGRIMKMVDLDSNNVQVNGPGEALDVARLYNYIPATETLIIHVSHASSHPDFWVAIQVPVPKIQAFVEEQSKFL